jgi:hypothetical protein
LLPILEVVSGVLLLFGFWLVPTAILATLMFASFLIATIINIVRETEIPCFCFGTGNLDKIGWHTAARILSLMVISIVLVFTAHLSFEISTLLHLPVAIIVPLVLLTIFGLLMLSLLETLPLVVKAWTAPAIARPKRTTNLVWHRERLKGKEEGLL